MIEETKIPTSIFFSVNFKVYTSTEMVLKVDGNEK